jgi:hypothetical protein
MAHTQLTQLWPCAVEDDWATLFILAHERRILKVCYQCCLALDTCERQVANLFAIELIPFLVVIALVERDDRVGEDEVDEGIADIALVLKTKTMVNSCARSVGQSQSLMSDAYLEINRKIEKVVLTSMILINRSKQHLLCVLVGNVLDHQGGTSFGGITNTICGTYPRMVRVQRMGIHYALLCQLTNIQNVLILVLSFLDRLQIVMVLQGQTHTNH